MGSGTDSKGPVLFLQRGKEGGEESLKGWNKSLTFLGPSKGAKRNRRMQASEKQDYIAERPGGGGLVSCGWGGVVQRKLRAEIFKSTFEKNWLRGTEGSFPGKRGLGKSG